MGIRCQIDGTRALWATVAAPDELLDRIAVTVDPFLPMAVIVASLEGRDVHIEADPDRLLRANLHLNFAPLVARFYGSRLARIIVAGSKDLEPLPHGRENPTDLTRPDSVGLLFSGGVDSFYNLMRLMETDLSVDHLVNVNAGSSGRDRDCWRHRYRRVSEIAHEFDVGVVGVDTNFHEIIQLSHPSVHTIRDTSAASVLAGAIDTFIYSSGNPYKTISFKDAVRDQVIAKIDPTLLSCLTRSDVSLLEFGFEADRIEKTRAIADYPPTYRHLDVCTDGRYQSRNEHGKPVNCSRCLKCLRAMATLDHIGKLERFSTQFDVSDFREHRSLRWTQLASSSMELDRDVVQWVNQRSSAPPRSRGILHILPHALRGAEPPDAVAGTRSAAGPPLVIREPIVVRGPGSTTVSCRIDRDRALTAVLTGPEAALSTISVTADAFAALVVLIASLEGRQIRIDARLDPVLHANLALNFAPLVAQIYGLPRVRMLPAHGEVSGSRSLHDPWVERIPAKPALGLLFSGGIDSFYALMRLQEIGLPIDYLVNINAGANGDHVSCWHQRFARVSSIGRDLGIPTIGIDTNFQKIVRLPHIIGHAIRNISAASLLRERVGILAYSATVTFDDVAFPSRSHPGSFVNIEHALTASFGQSLPSVIHVGWDANRIDKTMAVAVNRYCNKHLDICTNGAYQDVVDPSRPINCGQCLKCIRTMTTLERQGHLAEFSTQFDVASFRDHRNDLWRRLASSDDILDLEVVRWVAPELLPAETSQPLETTRSGPPGRHRSPGVRSPC